VRPEIQLEFEIERKESERDDIEDKITSIKERLDDREGLQSRREKTTEELTNLRTRIDQTRHVVDKRKSVFLPTAWRSFRTRLFVLQPLGVPAQMIFHEGGNEEIGVVVAIPHMQRQRDVGVLAGLLEQPWTQAFL
jgi:hypothetical protein